MNINQAKRNNVLSHVICTIISKNYTAYARTLVDSFLANTPGGIAYVLFTDATQEEIFQEKENFVALSLDDVIALDPSFFFQHNIVELNTAVKPAFIRYLLQRYNLLKIIYFDPDILILSDLNELYAELDTAELILTPHVVSITDEDQEKEFLQFGVFNLGFIGVANTPQIHRFLDWWHDRLMKYCIYDPEKGFFVDQKWMDLAGCLADNVRILRNPGYNVAYWNLHERTIDHNNNTYFANGKPIVFFHFSGFDPDLKIVSRSRPITKITDGIIMGLFSGYLQCLEKNGYSATKKIQYKYDFFDNGVRIYPWNKKEYYLMSDQEKSVFGNPFHTEDKKSYFNYLVEPIRATSFISRYLQELYLALPDLKKEMPNIDSDYNDEQRFLKWLREYFPEVLKVTIEARLADTEARLADTEARLADTEARLADTKARLADTEARLADTEAKLDVIEQGSVWRFIQSCRRKKPIVFLWKILKRTKIIFSRVRAFPEIIFSKKKVSKNQNNSRKLKKIVYVGHYYQNKTKSTAFIIDYLKQFYDVKIVLDESNILEENNIDRRPFPDLSFIDDSYFGVIFFQSLPPKIALENIINKNIIFFPMYDNFETWNREYWNDYRDLKIINFSKTLHDKLEEWGIKSMYSQYFPKPTEFIPGDKDEVFFWQRLSKININTIVELFRKNGLRIHIHKAVDPYNKFIVPSKDVEDEFQITYSKWFNTREEMWDIIKKKGIYVAPREFEGIGLSFLEAMAMGKAVVAVNNPTMNEYIENKKTGYLFDLKNPEEIDLSDIEQVQKNCYEFMTNGYQKWEKDKQLIIDFIENRNKD